MANAYTDNRYIQVGPHSSKYYVDKNPADKLYLELDMAPWLAKGQGNASTLTIAIGAWTDPGGNAPTVAASGAGHTASLVRLVLTAGTTSWNAGAGGGYAIRQGAVPIVVTSPDTDEVKEILLVVSVTDITDVLESVVGVAFDESGERVIAVSGNLQTKRIWLEPGENTILRLNFAPYLADRAAAVAITVGAISFGTWTGNASGATAPTAGSAVLTATTVDIPLALAANASMGSGSTGYRGMVMVTATLNAGQNNEEIRKIQVPIATRNTV